MLAELYSIFLLLSNDLATTYCLKQKKEKIGNVTRYLFIILPKPKSLIDPANLGCATLIFFSKPAYSVYDKLICDEEFYITPIELITAIHRR